jgi:large subunit ribosomal protein L3
MYRGLLGKKLGMSNIFSGGGEQAPVTVLEVGPCVVTQIKTQATDGYDALQVGFAEKKPSRINKPLAGHFKKSGGRGYSFLAEIAVDDPAEHELGETLTVDAAFQVGERVDVSGLSRGRGFAGVVKRWGFSGGGATHGSMFHRAPGSIGQSAWPSKVFKGRKLPGHHGNKRVTVRNLEVVDIRPNENIMIVRGGVPGSRKGFIEVRKPQIAPKK